MENKDDWELAPFKDRDVDAVNRFITLLPALIRMGLEQSGLPDSMGEGYKLVTEARGEENGIFIKINRARKKNVSPVILNAWEPEWDKLELKNLAAADDGNVIDFTKERELRKIRKGGNK